MESLAGGVCFLVTGAGWLYISTQPAILWKLTRESHSIEIVRLVSKFGAFFCFGISLLCFGSFFFGLFT